MSHARVVWDGQKNKKCRGIEGQRAACASYESMWRDLGGGGVRRNLLVQIICISAGPVTHHLRSASVK